MSCDIAKLINEYELAAKKFRYSESQEWFEQKCKTYEAIVKAVSALEAEIAELRRVGNLMADELNALGCDAYDREWADASARGGGE